MFLRWEIILDYLSGPNIITWVLKIRELSNCGQKRDVMVEDDQRDATLPALKMEEGAMSQGMRGAPRRWKRQGDIFSPRVSRREHTPADTLILVH